MNFQNPDETVAQLIARFGPKRAGPYARLRPHAEFIGELRRNCASYDTIVAILRERNALQVSNTTVRKFCRDVLCESSGKRGGRRPAPPAPATAPQTISPRPAPKPKLAGPQIAEVEFIEQPNP